MSGIVGGAGSKSGVIGITELMVSTEHSNTGTTNAFYEEGDWNLACSNLSNRAGRYIKIGNLIHIWGWVYLTAGGTAGTTLTGLPFTSIDNEDGEASAIGGGSVVYQNSETAASWQVKVTNGDSTFGFVKGSTDMDLAASKQAHFALTYRIAPGFGYSVS